MVKKTPTTPNNRQIAEVLQMNYFLYYQLKYFCKHYQFDTILFGCILLEKTL